MHVSQEASGMAARRFSILLVLATVSTSMGASYRTQNFVIEAPTPEIAQQVGQYAEHYRKEKAMQWLGQEMAPWAQACPVYVKITHGGAGGATSFVYSQGQVMGQQMEISGSLDRLLNSVLPHEVTHTVFAYYFRRPVPRWADEGGSVLSEDDAERDRHDVLVRQILNTPGREIPLRRLFQLTEYPDDVMSLYAEGFSVSSFLVGNKDRATFLAFVNSATREGWDSASKRYYGYENVDALERAWHQHLIATKRQPAQYARNPGPTESEQPNRMVVRLTAPPVPPLQENPSSSMIIRGQAPEGDWNRDGWSRPRSTPEGRPTSMQNQYRSEPFPPPSGAVMLGMPQALPQPTGTAVQLGVPTAMPAPISGYQR
jgi:hypothetical protein